jgi:N-methylhydantoinase B/oxoprolinase/acetone carboxylase alpha subunit
VLSGSLSPDTAGWGDPAERDPELISHDAREGYA